MEFKIAAKIAKCKFPCKCPGLTVINKCTNIKYQYFRYGIYNYYIYIHMYIVYSEIKHQKVHTQFMKILMYLYMSYIHLIFYLLISICLSVRPYCSYSTVISLLCPSQICPKGDLVNCHFWHVGVPFLLMLRMIKPNVTKIWT